ncbi:hypothetical protein [Nostoc sp.]|uniref:hypothetical protein n=1 Tax=Nostoc sp. TaxID=1180 RepID=UPI002FF6C440
MSLGLFYIADRQGDSNNPFTVPNYLRTDAAIFYNQGGFRVGVNVRSLFDVDYFETSHRLRVFPGDPLTVVGSISWEL